MNKAELVDAIATATGQTKAAVTAVVDQLPLTITDALRKGEPVNYFGLGNFDVATRAARTGRSPKTGMAIEIPAKKVVKFKAAKRLGEHL